MKNNSFFLLKIVKLMAFGALGCSLSQAQVSTSSSTIGIITYDANWKKQNWEQLKGKKRLLLTFFPRCFTGNCTSQLTSLRDAYPELQKADVEVWAISTDEADGPEGQRAFGKSLKLPFPLIPDPSRKLCLRFGAVQSPLQMATRMSILFDKEGKMVWVDKQIDPRTHGADVLARVRKDEAAAPEPAKEPQPEVK